MILQIYNFALMVNHRNDSQPGATLPIQVFFAYFTMHLYFLRTNHRDRMSSIQVGRVCPGNTGCPVAVHYPLLLVDMILPYIIGHLTMPLIVKARVRHGYAYQMVQLRAASSQAETKK